MFDSSFCYSVLSFPHADTFIRIVVSRVLLFELPVRLAVLRSRLITSWVRLDILSDRFVVLRVRLITGYPGSSSFVAICRFVVSLWHLIVSMLRFTVSTRPLSEAINRLTLTLHEVLLDAMRLYMKNIWRIYHLLFVNWKWDLWRADSSPFVFMKHMAAREVEEQRMMGKEKGRRRRLPPLFSPYPSHLALPFLGTHFSLCCISCVETTGDKSVWRV